jgi:hypothetical protein
MDLGPSRARNAEHYSSLGDPERWGGTIVWDLVLEAGDLPVAKYSPQIVRVQAEDLIARPFDLAMTYSAPDWQRATDIMSAFGLELTWGVGQTTTTAILACGGNGGTGSFNIGEMANADFLNPFASPAGGVQMKTPVPAVALAVRGWALANATVPGRVIPITISVTVAPRALALRCLS